MQKFYACLAIVIATVIAQPQSALTKDKGKPKDNQIEYLPIILEAPTITNYHSETKPPPTVQTPAGLVNSPAGSNSVGASRANPTHR